MRNFAAIDFETANGKRTSVCSVGVVIVKDGKIVNKIYRLIRPAPNYYSKPLLLAMQCVISFV